MQPGRHRGRPRLPWSGGIASTSGNASCESCRLAPVKRIASGTPRASQIKCRLLPRLARSVGFGPVLVPPHTARTEQLSTTARDQSIWSSRASQSSTAKCINSQIPMSCQSRKRRQHVMPEPQPSSCSNICHGIPLRSTKRIPVRQARSGLRGLPPFGRGDGTGRRGSMRSRSVSGSSTAAISPDVTPADSIPDPPVLCCGSLVLLHAFSVLRVLCVLSSGEVDCVANAPTVARLRSCARRWRPCRSWRRSSASARPWDARGAGVPPRRSIRRRCRL